MSVQALIYLGVTVAFFVIFAVIVIRTYRKGSKDQVEAPKYRMLDDE